ncbi:MAG: hypothetical protein FJ410_06685 [Verrucomicrobia bacterium]|nr:hypothetical protein [Verrucomicrobiota bacterium]
MLIDLLGAGFDVAGGFQTAIAEFKRGGWIVALIGAAAMVGRLLIDDAAHASLWRSFRHVAAAAIFAIIAFFVTFQWQLSAINKAIVQGLAGALAPELVDWITGLIRKKLGMAERPRQRKGRKKSSGRKRAKPKAAPRARRR